METKEEAITEMGQKITGLELELAKMSEACEHWAEKAGRFAAERDELIEVLKKEKKMNKNQVLEESIEYYEITVKIKWDLPAEQNWLNPDNVSLALHAYCPNTKFDVSWANQDSEEID